MQPRLEALEARDLLSVTATLQGSLLNLVGDGTRNNVLVRTTPNTPGSTDVVINGQATSFTGLTQVNYSDGNGGDTFTNRTTLPGTIQLGDGNNLVYTIAPGSVVTSGNGYSILQVTGGNSVITVGNANNNIYGGPGDTITAGTGTNIIYDILPGNQTITVAPHAGVDHLFVGPQTTLLGAQAQDHVAQFFVAGRTLGSGTLVQQGATLYFTGDNQGDTFLAQGDSRQLTVVYRLGGTGPFQVATFTGVNQIAAFGGAGNDVFLNNSTVDDVMYGAGGSNVLVGGFGQLDLEKAGGQAATGSVAIGRSPVYNDLNGSGLTNTSNTLLFTNPGAHNIARTNSPTDAILGANVLVSLYPDQVVAAFLPPFVPA